MRALPALTALALVAYPAGAATLTIVKSSADEVALIDPAATKFDSETRKFQAWTVAVRRTLGDAEPARPGYVRTLNEYDCVARRYRWLTSMTYSRYGELVLKQDNPAAEWVAGYQAAGEDPNFRAVCDQAGAGAIAAPTLAQLVISLMQAWDPAPESAPVTPPAKPPAVGRKGAKS